ncbi:hypothetical protein ACS0TY_012286 [Phlomoides rotata]
MSSTSTFSCARCISSILCDCGVNARLRTSWSQDNPGRRFYGCKFLRVKCALQPGGEDGCYFFRWFDTDVEQRQRTIILNLLREKREITIEKKKEKTKSKWWKIALIGSWIIFIVVLLST